jgi:phosphoglycolate phosphatase
VSKNITILFDLDGTLIDSTDAILESFDYAFKKQKFNFGGDNEEIKSHIGYPLDIMFENLGVEKNRVTDFVASYKENYKEIYEQKTVLLDSAKESVELASNFARLAVVTTKTTNYTIPLLKKLGIFEYFETIIGRQEVKNPKPDPEPIQTALKNMGIASSRDVFMIGDTKLDLIAANRASISSCGVLCGYGYKKELCCYTPYVTTNALEAVKLIKSTISKAYCKL